eukprot:403368656
MLSTTDKDGVNSAGLYRRSYTPWWAVGLTTVIIAIFWSTSKMQQKQIDKDDSLIIEQQLIDAKELFIESNNVQSSVKAFQYEPIHQDFNVSSKNTKLIDNKLEQFCSFDMNPTLLNETGSDDKFYKLNSQKYIHQNEHQNQQLNFNNLDSFRNSATSSQQIEVLNQDIINKFYNESDIITQKSVFTKEPQPLQQNKNLVNQPHQKIVSSSLTSEQLKAQNQKRRLQHKLLQQKVAVSQDITLQNSNMDEKFLTTDKDSQNFNQQNRSSNQNAGNESFQNQEYFLSFGDKQFQKLLRQSLGEYQQIIEGSKSSQMIQELLKNTINEEDITFQNYNSSKFTSNQTQREYNKTFDPFKITQRLETQMTSDYKPQQLDVIPEQPTSHFKLLEVYDSIDQSVSEQSLTQSLPLTEKTSQRQSQDFDYLDGKISNYNPDKYAQLKRVQDMLNESEIDHSLINQSLGSITEEQIASINHDQLMSLLKQEKGRLSNLREMLDEIDRQNISQTTEQNDSSHIQRDQDEVQRLNSLEKTKEYQFNIGLSEEQNLENYILSDTETNLKINSYTKQFQKDNIIGSLKSGSNDFENIKKIQLDLFDSCTTNQQEKTNYQAMNIPQIKINLDIQSTKNKSKDNQKSTSQYPLQENKTFQSTNQLKKKPQETARAQQKTNTKTAQQQNQLPKPTLQHINQEKGRNSLHLQFLQSKFSTSPHSLIKQTQSTRNLAIPNIKSQSRTPTRKLQVQYLKYQNPKLIKNTIKGKLNQSKDLRILTPVRNQNKQQYMDKENVKINSNLSQSRSRHSILNLDFKMLNNNENIDRSNSGYSQSKSFFVNDLTQNNTVVFNTSKLQKVKGIEIDNKKASITPFKQKNYKIKIQKLGQLENDSEIFEEKNFQNQTRGYQDQQLIMHDIINVEHDEKEQQFLNFQERQSYVQSMNENHEIAQNIKQKIDYSITQLNHLFEGFIKQKQMQEASQSQASSQQNYESKQEYLHINEQQEAIDHQFLSQIFDKEIIEKPQTRQTQPFNQRGQNTQPELQKLNKFIEGDQALSKFAMSLFVVKEMTNRYPYLKKAAENYLDYNK